VKRALTLLTIAMAFAAGFLVASHSTTVQGQAAQTNGWAAIPGEKGGWDLFGPYEPVANWPKPLSTLPGEQGWTWGAVEGIFAETPDRVYIVQRGELPDIKRPAQIALPQVGPSLAFPVGQVPFRNASQGVVSSPPGAGGPGANPDDPAQAWKGRMGIDAKWENNFVVVNAAGDIVERWTQWDKMFRRPHAVYVNPYDPEKHVWVVDDHGEDVLEFTHDGKQLVKTIGTPSKAGDDAMHFNRPTFLAWLPDGTMFVSDGYNGHRVKKFDKNGKFLLSWGEKGEGTGAKPDTRPGYFNVVHGLAVDPQTRRVYVSDRGNRRMQVFDENGKFLDQWSFAQPSSVNFLYLGEDHNVWAFDDTTSHIIKYDPQGHPLYAWGALGDYPGALFNMHGASVDQQGNVYVAEVAGGRAQKFRPRAGAKAETLIAKPIYGAWR